MQQKNPKIQQNIIMYKSTESDGNMDQDIWVLGYYEYGYMVIRKIIQPYCIMIQLTCQQ